MLAGLPAIGERDWDESEANGAVAVRLRLGCSWLPDDGLAVHEEREETVAQCGEADGLSLEVFLGG